MANIVNNTENVHEIHAIFNTKFAHIDKACIAEFDDGVIEFRKQSDGKEPVIAKKTFLTRKTVQPLQTKDKSRDKIKTEEFLQAIYVEDEA